MDALRRGTASMVMLGRGRQDPSLGHGAEGMRDTLI